MLLAFMKHIVLEPRNYLERLKTIRVPKYNQEIGLNLVWQISSFLALEKTIQKGSAARKDGKCDQRMPLPSQLEKKQKYLVEKSIATLCAHVFSFNNLIW